MRQTKLFTAIAFIMLAGMMISCGEKQQKEPGTSALKDEKSIELYRESITNMIKEIYAIVGGEIDVRVNIDEAFCSKEWNELVSEVNKKDAQMPEGEIGFFDFNYWLQAQDYDSVSVSDISIDFGSTNKANTTFTLHNLGTETPMQLTFIYENGKWVIDNIINKGQSAINMKKKMKKYLGKK